ncbi:MAG: AI-2E family transporter [Planctomycetota bacterium]|nr:AI-2E family transporter [Planctomycetota bacterium]
MLERLSKNNRNIALVAIGLLLGWFAWKVRAVLNPLILGYLLAYILRPLVARLEERGMRRRKAVNIIFALFGAMLVLLLGGVFVQGRQFVEGQVELAERGEDPFTRAEQNLDALLGRVGAFWEESFGDVEGGAAATTSGDDPEAIPATGPGPIEAPESGGTGPEAAREQGGAAAGDRTGVEPPAADPAEETLTALDGDPAAAGAVHHDPGELTVRQLVRAWFAEWSEGDGEVSGFTKAQIVLGYVQRIFGGVLSIFAFLMLLPVYTYFLLFELERIHGFLRSHVPKKERERVTRIGRAVGAVIANFFRGRLLISLLKGLVLSIGLTALGVPHGFLLGMLAGFLSLIPFVGPTIGFVGTELVALQQLDGAGHGGLWTLGLIGALFTLAELLEGYVLIPKILGDSLGLHPVVILVAVFVGGAALGLFGFLLAIPLAATLIILFRELVMPALADFAEEDSHVDGELDQADR